MAFSSFASTAEKQVTHMSATNFMEWTNSDVCRFFIQNTNKKQSEISKSAQKHQLIGQDIIDLTEQNLLELGVQTIHERKQILRAIKSLINSPNSTFGTFNVKFMDNTSHSLQEVRLKVLDDKTKVKHVIEQAYTIFKQHPSDFHLYCLTPLPISESRVILSNDSSMLSLLKGSNKIEEFAIVKSQLFFGSSTQPSSVCSPLRTMGRQVVSVGENSLDRLLIQSPNQKIYIQTIDGGQQEVASQLNPSNSDAAIRENQNLQSQILNTAQKSNRKPQHVSSVSKKTKTSKDSQNTNREGYLQNYITSNKQQLVKKQSHPTAQPQYQFQFKKHSVNEVMTTVPTTFNYNGQMIPTAGTTTSNTGAFNSLSRGNSIKKMKTISSGGTNHGNSAVKQPQIQSTTAINQQAAALNPAGKRKRSSFKGKSMNIYQTIGTGGQNQYSLKKKISSPKNNPIGLGPEIIPDDFVKIINDAFTENTRIGSDLTPASLKTHYLKDQVMHLSKNKPGTSSNKGSFIDVQSIPKLNLYQQTIDPYMVNNLNEIFSDFLDEQNNHQQYIQPGVQNRHQTMSVHSNMEQAPQKSRGNSHSRQHILFEEDSLENKNKDQLLQQKSQLNQQHTLDQSQFNNQNMINGGAMIPCSFSTQDQRTQRPIKHMQHKSMYALNSNQAKQQQTTTQKGVVKKQQQNNLMSKYNQQQMLQINNQQQPQFFGTFDNSCTSQQIKMNLNQAKENFNYSNLQQNNQKEILVNSKTNAQLHQQRIQTEQYDNIPKENMFGSTGPGFKNTQYNNYGDDDEVNLLTGSEVSSFKVPGLQSTVKKASNRSGSNPSKHKNNRYSDRGDDILMFDTSEDVGCDETSMVIR